VTEDHLKVLIQDSWVEQNTVKDMNCRGDYGSKFKVTMEGLCRPTSINWVLVYLTLII
jgi:hypothetical protein